MDAIILAAGKGKRLAPLTNYAPKSLLPINSRPILSYALDNIIEAKIENVVITLGYMAEKIESFLKNEYSNKINYKTVLQNPLLGTGHAVLLAKHLIKSDFVVLAGDTAFNKGLLKKQINFHNQNQADISFVLKKLRPKGLMKTSCVRLENKKITEFFEKPTINELVSEYAASLFHIYPHKAFEYLNELKKSTRGEYELTAIVNPMINDGYQVYGQHLPLSPDLTETQDLLKKNFDYLETYL